MRIALSFAAVVIAIAAPAAAQIGPSPQSDPRIMAEQGRAAAADRAASAAAQSRQTDLTLRNLQIDRTVPAQGGERDAARGDLARERLEARQAEAADALRREQQERLRLETLDPTAAPR